MTREEALHAYRPIRAAIQRILEKAPFTCTTEKCEEATDDVAPWAEGEQMSDEAITMVMDVALFEIGEEGERAIDRFVASPPAGFSADELALIGRMKGAWFSLFRVAGPHEAGGLWFEDLLDDERRIWVMDESLAMSAEPNDIFGMRLFDTGPFWAGFGIAVEPDDDVLGSCLAAQARRQPLPTLFSLASCVYSNSLIDSVPPDEQELEASEMADTFADFLAKAAPLLIEHRVPLKKGKSKRGSRRKHRK